MSTKKAEWVVWGIGTALLIWCFIGTVLFGQGMIIGFATGVLFAVCAAAYDEIKPYRRDKAKADAEMWEEVADESAAMLALLPPEQRDRLRQLVNAAEEGHEHGA